MEKIILIGCGAKKLNVPAEAEQLYCGRHFQALRDYAAASGHAWYILSSCYGLVRPDSTLQPYDLRITEMSKSERQVWARKLVQTFYLFSLESPPFQIELLAGNDYADHLVPEMERRGFTVSRPLRGMAIGKQYQWLKANTKGEADE